jgi:DNA-binding response OmpR family regulator
MKTDILNITFTSYFNNTFIRNVLKRKGGINLQYTVFLVEDDKKLRETIIDYLCQNGFNVISASDGKKALDVYDTNSDKIDIVLLDGMLPEMDGIDVLKIIRKTSNVPVIMISARESESDQLLGYYTGADNYITKPFMLSVLKEQITALLNRTVKAPPKTIKKGAVVIDINLRRVYVDGNDISATPKEYDLLLYFFENERIVLERDTILDRVWGMDYFGDFRTVDTIIKQLRKKLTDKHKYINSVYGVGYYFEVNDD